MILKGIILGFIVVLPGMSGGTLLLIMGIYQKLLRDLSNLKLLPWLPFILGAVGGVFLSGMALSWLFLAYRDLVSAFLLGSVLASVKAVVGQHFQATTSRVLLFIAGAILGLVMATAPIGIVNEAIKPGIGLLFFRGSCRQCRHDDSWNSRQLCVDSPGDL
jgi:putative membrane protein